MTGFLLDTNVISEVTRDAPDPLVSAFLAAEGDLWLPVVVVHEMEYGVSLLPSGRRRDRLVELHTAIYTAFADRILPLDRSGAEWAARFRAEAQRLGRPMDLGDALIAGIARANQLTVATRNVRDFEMAAVDLVNPWDNP